MNKAFVGVLVIAMIGSAAAAQPLGSAPSVHPSTHGSLARKTLVRTAFAPVGTDRARGLLIAALLLGAIRYR
jgi:hypothetical protein